jgi:RNA polymerase sigma-70 factor (ECF subfamily)
VANLASTLDDIVRRDRSRIVGALLRLCGSLDAAEEALHEALLAALAVWPAQGTPDQPVAWLIATAKNRARDTWRRRAVADAKASELVESAMTNPETIQTITDDQLRLIFTCCHSSLARDDQVALTLKVIVGFTTEEIARAFVCPETTMAQRIVRAKRALEGADYTVPDSSELSVRIAGVLEVVYLIFNEGHTARDGALVRIDLHAQALRLGRLLEDLVPREPAVYGLVAMMAFSAARAATRTDAAGALLLLSEQDRSRWNAQLIEEGLIALQRARSLGGADAYVLQAEIAACHVAARSWEATPWPSILTHYDALLELTHSPVVALNRAVAIGMVEGPDAALAELAELERTLEDYHLFYATRADFLRRAGRDPRPDLERALALATNDSERAFLDRRIVEISAAETSARQRRPT